jgi:tRNA threonylcarbamoyl adenosine modification protein TsaD/tRNA threonylcarbamoyl adenosine modification protein YeaZ
MDKPYLILDTSTDRLLLALSSGERDQLLAEHSIPAARSANQKLVPSIQQLLADNGVDKADLAGVVCGIGPGSFTGIRIAIATTKGLCMALGIPAYGVSTHDAMAEAALRDKTAPTPSSPGPSSSSPGLSGGSMSSRQPDYPNKSGNDVVRSGNDKYCFATSINALRGEFSVACYRVDASTGNLEQTDAAKTVKPEALPNLPLYEQAPAAGDYWAAYRRGHSSELAAVYTRPSFAEEKEAERGQTAPADAPQPVEDFATTSKENAECDAGTVPASHSILAIESSCDETAAAVMSLDGALLSNVISTQIAAHARFNGVVPEIASRKHTEYIAPVVAVALEDAGALPKDLAAVAVTYAPGLIGGLVVGVAFAKGLAWAQDLPLVVVNHLEGHIYANRLDNPDLEPPFVCALLSGGNTMLVQVKAWGDYRILGETMDDAAGECFDKVSKALGLGYPGGPAISKAAQGGNPAAIRFPRALIGRHDFMFSFSGLKTAVLEYLHTHYSTPSSPAAVSSSPGLSGGSISSWQPDYPNKSGNDGKGKSGNDGLRLHKANEERFEIPAGDMADICASFEAAIIDVQVRKAVKAVQQTGVKTFCVGGGVAANSELRRAYQEAFGKLGIRVALPGKIACTDNAAMIARVALDRYQAGRFADLSADAYARADLEQPY